MRLFLALWPDAGARERLAKLASHMAAQHGGRAVAATRIHLTLVFLGEVADDRAAIADRAVRGVEFGTFPVRLDVLGSFGKTRIGWAGFEGDAPAELAALQSTLASRLTSAGFACEERPFVPHATLVRGLTGATARERIEAVEWEVTGLSLMRTLFGTGRYEELGSFPAGRRETR